MIRFTLYSIIFITIFNGCEGPIFDVPADQDLIPPTLTITYPPDQAEVSDTVLVSAYAFDNVEIESVTIYLNDSIIHESKEGPYIYNWPTMDNEDDTYHTIRARAIDTTGNTNYTDPIQVLVNNYDNINPTGSFIYPFEGQRVSGEVNIIIQANDNDLVSKVILFINGESVDTLHNEPYSYLWDTNDLIEDEIFSIHAKVIDNENNHTILSPINVSINNYEDENIDLIPPVVSLLYPISTQTVSDTVLIHGFANDNDVLSSIRFFINGELFHTTLDTPYSVFWNTYNEDNYSQHSIQMVAEDIAGNQTATQPVLVTVFNAYSGTINNLIVVSNENLITLNWDIPNGAESFRIYRNNIFLTETNQNEYEEILISVDEFCYTVSAINSSNLEGPLSSEECITITLPPSPELSSSIEGTTVFLNWTSVITADSYRIYQEDDFILEVNTLSHSMEINPEINTCYTVTSVNRYGSESTPSNEECVSVTPPTPPTLSLDINDNIATLNWTSVQTATSYRIYENDIFLIEQTELSYNQEIESETNTCFFVTSVDSYGIESDNSNEECSQDN